MVSYLAMGLPTVIAGFVLVHERDLLATAAQYGVAVMVLAALALLGAARPVRQPATAPVPVSGPAPSRGPGPVPANRRGPECNTAAGVR